MDYFNAIAMYQAHVAFMRQYMGVADVSEKRCMIRHLGTLCDHVGLTQMRYGQRNHDGNGPTEYQLWDGEHMLNVTHHAFKDMDTTGLLDSEIADLQRYLT